MVSVSKLLIHLWIKWYDHLRNVQDANVPQYCIIHTFPVLSLYVCILTRNTVKQNVQQNLQSYIVTFLHEKPPHNA
jgi:carotenoid cleavage dioxygenase-like enzyme